MTQQFKRPGDIKVGVIGYSSACNMGCIHLKDMQAAGMRPTAVAELNQERLQAAAQDFPGIETYASVDEMLRQSAIHLVTIITPHNSHAELALQCLRAGRHVVCEKPFAITTAECDAMIREARRRNLLVTAYHNRHWDGCIHEAVKQIRKQRAIGDVYRVEAHMGDYGRPLDWWRSSKSISGGILYDWGVHLLEYALQIIDAEIAEVSGFALKGYWTGQTAWKEDTNEDESCAIVRFRNGVWLSLNISHVAHSSHRGVLEVFGTEGTYLMEFDGYEIIQRKANRQITTRGKNPPGQWGKFYRNIMDHFTKGRELVISPEWARRPIHILDLADRSARSGKAMKAKYR